MHRRGFGRILAFVGSSILIVFVGVAILNRLASRFPTVGKLLGSSKGA